MSDIIYPARVVVPFARDLPRRELFFIPLPKRHDLARRTSPIKSCRARRTNVRRRKDPVALSARKEEDRCVDGEIQRASNCASRSGATVARKIRIRRMRAADPDTYDPDITT